MKNISDVDLAYLAGFTDGEGCIGMSRSRQRVNNDGYRREHYTAAVTLTNTNKELLLNLREMIGAGSVYIKDARKSEKHKTAWALVFTYPEQQELLPKLLPFLKLKKEQAKLLIEFFNLGNCHMGGVHTPDLKIEAIRSLIYDELKILNKRGN